MLSDLNSDFNFSIIDSFTKKSKKFIKHASCSSTITFLKYVINHYNVYNSDHSSVVAAVNKMFISYNKYDHYLLFIKSNLNKIKKISTVSICIDDLIIFHVIDKMKTDSLHHNWSANLNKMSMIQATCMLLENVIKMYINVKEMNIDEMIITQNETDYYYKWWRDLHCLMSDEKFRKQMYLIHLLHETFHCDEFNFKMKYKTVMQISESQNEQIVQMFKNAKSKIVAKVKTFKLIIT